MIENNTSSSEHLCLNTFAREPSLVLLLFSFALFSRLSTSFFVERVTTSANFVIRYAKILEIDVLDAGGNPIKGFSREDSIAVWDADGMKYLIAWKNEKKLSKFAGKPASIRVGWIVLLIKPYVQNQILYVPFAAPPAEFLLNAMLGAEIDRTTKN